MPLKNTQQPAQDGTGAIAFTMLDGTTEVRVFASHQLLARLNNAHADPAENMNVFRRHRADLERLASEKYDRHKPIDGDVYLDIQDGALLP